MKHVLQFARYWCRPLDGAWRFNFTGSLILLVASFLRYGPPWWAYINAGVFVFCLISYTYAMVLEYRAGPGGDGPPAGGKPPGDRYEVHDRHDIFRRWPWL